MADPTTLHSRVAIIGGGPVGCLVALSLAQRGASVDIYESRTDPRLETSITRASQRSINLALSLRGITGLRSVHPPLANLVLAEAVPITGRMIHSTKGDQQSQSYGGCINSVDRARLNMVILGEAERHERVTIHFAKTLKGLHFEEEVKLIFQDGDKMVGMVVGCDGAHSAVRSAMAGLVRMNYTHEYIDNGYVELSIPPRTFLGAGSRLRGDGGVTSKGGHDAWSLDPNHLHIWPRYEFMLIALPNRDGSFTCTLFAPFSVFSGSLSTEHGILAFFRQHFPDALPLIGEQRVVEDLLSRRPSPLGSVKCTPYHYKDRCVLIGDAAHAMLPFYGQGLNCGFEDVRILMQCIDEQPDLSQALKTYTDTRHPDLLAINKLARDNYTEMATNVLSPTYLCRKKLDTLLMAILPAGAWKSLYSMVTFSNLGYAEVVKREEWQSTIVSWVTGISAVGLVAGTAFSLLKR